jgi:hypothetical protein
MTRESGVEQIKHLKRVLDLMREIQGELRNTADASRRAELNRQRRDNRDAFIQAVAGIVRIAPEDPHAWALVNLVDDDPDLDRTRWSDIPRTAPTWANHIDAALSTDEDGPVGDDYEYEDL